MEQFVFSPQLNQLDVPPVLKGWNYTNENDILFLKTDSRARFLFLRNGYVHKRKRKYYRKKENLHFHYYIIDTKCNRMNASDHIKCETWPEDFHSTIINRIDEPKHFYYKAKTMYKHETKPRKTKPRKRRKRKHEEITNDSDQMNNGVVYAASAINYLTPRRGPIFGGTKVEIVCTLSEDDRDMYLRGIGVSFGDRICENVDFSVEGVERKVKGHKMFKNADIYEEVDPARVSICLTVDTPQVDRPETVAVLVYLVGRDPFGEETNHHQSSVEDLFTPKNNEGGFTYVSNEEYKTDVLLLNNKVDLGKGLMSSDEFGEEFNFDVENREDSGEVGYYDFGGGGLDRNEFDDILFKRSLSLHKAVGKKSLEEVKERVEKDHVNVCEEDPWGKPASYYAELYSTQNQEERQDFLEINDYIKKAEKMYEIEWFCSKCGKNGIFRPSEKGIFHKCCKGAAMNGNNDGMKFYNRLKIRHMNIKKGRCRTALDKEVMLGESVTCEDCEETYRAHSVVFNGKNVDVYGESIIQDQVKFPIFLEEEERKKGKAEETNKLPTKNRDRKKRKFKIICPSCDQVSYGCKGKHIYVDLKKGTLTHNCKAVSKKMIFKNKPLKDIKLRHVYKKKNEKCGYFSHTVFQNGVGYCDGCKKVVTATEIRLSKKFFKIYT